VSTYTRVAATRRAIRANSLASLLRRVSSALAVGSSRFRARCVVRRAPDSKVATGSGVHSTELPSSGMACDSQD
jgi:hypothetical protein